MLAVAAAVGRVDKMALVALVAFPQGAADVGAIATLTFHLRENRKASSKSYD